jgi:predicted 3-demethylubiquinone-9 3-methyltransferase (glyoxalase superfamily)
MTTIQHKITPHLWFDKEAKEAAELYCSVIPDSRVTNVTTLHDTPSGEANIVSFELAGLPFMGISAGPLFKFNPSISFFVRCRKKDEVGAIWNKLSQDGMALMELGAYPWSEMYGWLQDKYGLTWQVSYAGENEIRQRIAPHLMFVGNVCGKAEQAMNFYASVFKDASVGQIMRYGKGEEPDKEGSVKYATFSLFGMEFGAMDSAYAHAFNFNEAISLMVSCDTQPEIDYYWEKLSAIPEAEQCGWLKDKYGVSWQITPSAMGEMMAKGTSEQIDRLTQAFLPMKKFDLAKLKKAYEGS